MNLVRLPLSAEWINENRVADNYICGEYRYQPTLTARTAAATSPLAARAARA